MAVCGCGPLYHISDGYEKDQNRRLVEKINYELSKENYDKENIDSIRRRT